MISSGLQGDQLGSAAASPAPKASTPRPTTQKLDALVTFTRGIDVLTDPFAGEASTGGSSTLAAVAGYPSLTHPAATLHGLPIGVSFVGLAWSEAKLLALADFEARAGKRKPPEFLETIRATGG